MTTDMRIECPLCGRHATVRTTGPGGTFLERKAQKRLQEHQAAGCQGWIAKKSEPDLGQAFDMAYEDQCAAACGL